MAARKYRTVDKYIVYAECIAPIHMGSASGDMEEVLVHPVTGTPFIQASSIAGLMKSISERINGVTITDTLFGYRELPEGRNASDFGSVVKISDGIFELDTVKMEIRPRVRINPSTGTVSSESIKGSGNTAGQKFEIESIGAGAKFTFKVYLFDNELAENLEKVFAELAAERVQFGGQKSNGQGFVSLHSLKHKAFNLKDAADRLKWAEEETLSDGEYEELIGKLQSPADSTVAYIITAKGATEGSVLVKSLTASYSDKEETADAVNIKNAKGEFIVPGSSLKGALRNYAESIARRIGKGYLIDCMFGTSGTDKESCNAGCISVWDSIIGKERRNEDNSIQYHIHIDKFTGGVFEQGLFSTKDVCGNSEFKINISESKYASTACGLMLMTLRDLNAGLMSIGSGYSVGKGFIRLETIEIKDCREDAVAVISFKDGKIDDNNNVIPSVLSALKDA